MLTYLVAGLEASGIILLASLGFSMVRTTEKFLNIAHAEFLVVGTYLTYAFHVIFGLHFFVAAILSMLCTAAFGVLVARTVFEPMRQAGPVVLLITSVALAYLIHGLVGSVFGDVPRNFGFPTGKAIFVGGISVGTLMQIVTFLVAFVAVGLLILLIHYTRLGLWIRALANDFDLALVRGVNALLVSTVVWAISAALAALAGILYGLIHNFTPDLGFDYILIVLSATVVGGLGSLYGVIAGAFLIGLVANLSMIVMPSAYAQASAFLVMVLVIILRPQGIFGGAAE